MEETPPRPLVVGVTTDLIFTSKIRAAAEAAGCAFKNARSEEAFQGALAESPVVVLVDLTTPHGFGVLERLTDHFPRPSRVVGFYPHVERALGARAAAFSFLTVMTRSKFVDALEQIVSHAASRVPKA